MTTLGITILVVLFIAAFIGMLLWFEFTCWDCTWTFHLFLGSWLYACVSGFVTLFAFGIMYLCSYKLPHTPDKESKQEISIYSIGLDTRFEVNGRFILGSGSLHGETEPTYRFYTKNGERYKLIEVKAQNYDIVCTNDVEPKIVIDYTRTVAYPRHPGWLFDDPDYEYIDFLDQHGTIYIPENSIVQSYEIRL